MHKNQVTAVGVESLSHEGRGVARYNGKAVFIEGALPGERVSIEVTRPRRSYDLARTREILEASPDRVSPRCPHFGTCGGCSLQHLRSEAQLEAKNQILKDNLQRIGKVSARRWLPPLAGEFWQYRRRARLGVRLVEKKGGVIVGFREKSHSFVTPLQECHTLDPRVSTLLPALSPLVAVLSRPDRFPQIEIAAGDTAVALVFRHLVPLTDSDRDRLTAFGRLHGVHIHAQAGAPDTIEAIWPLSPSPLEYRVPQHDCTFEFSPGDFIQVNASLNRQMIDQAMRLTGTVPTDRVVDLFCGLGNFTLPWARRAREVVGIESDPGLIRRARTNAVRNRLTNVRFERADLFAELQPVLTSLQDYDLWLLDPPRTGAIQVVRQIDPDRGPRQLLYVSCNPSTLARDAEVIVHAKKYHLAAAGVLDMFPQTSHVEAMALFERGE